MALTVNTTVWEVRTTGNDLNAGGFNPARDVSGVDRSQQDSPHVTIDGATITATVHTSTDQLNIVGFTVSAADLGNIVNITGGSMTAGRYEITVVDVGNNRWTIDRSGGTAGQTGTGRMGGALATPGHAAGAIVDKNKVWVRSGAAYLITTTTSNVSNGRLQPGRSVWEGYQTTRGDLGTAPILRASGITATTLVSLQAANDFLITNIEIDGNNLSTIKGLQLSGRGLIWRCMARNCTDGGIEGTSSILMRFFECVATACSGSAPAFKGASDAANPIFYACVAYNNTTVGFDLTNSSAHRCIAAGNTTGITLPSGCAIGCVSYGNSDHGFDETTGAGGTKVNCIAEGNGGFGFKNSVSGQHDAGNTSINCAGFNNASGNANADSRIQVGFIAGLTSFFVDAVNRDFRLNSDSGGGALIKNVGTPVTFPSTITASKFDIGAAETEDVLVSMGARRVLRANRRTRR